MFYYVIYNSTVLNYSNNNKKLNTFIYGTVLYILSHGLINSYDNQFAKYIKSYFWVILAIDIFSIYYLHNFIDSENNNENENDKNSLKSLLETFYNKQDKDKENKTNEKENKREDNVNLEIHKKENKKENNEIDGDENEEEKEEEPLPYFPDDLDINEKIKNNIENISIDDNNINENFDQMSEAGSDFDLDKFEESLQ
jgi:hypothetical protein